MGNMWDEFRAPAAGELAAADRTARVNHQLAAFGYLGFACCCFLSLRHPWFLAGSAVFAGFAIWRVRKAVLAERRAREIRQHNEIVAFVEAVYGKDGDQQP